MTLAMTSTYWWETIFLLSAAPAADTAVMSETKGVRQLVAKTEYPANIKTNKNIKI